MFAPFSRKIALRFGKCIEGSSHYLGDKQDFKKQKTDFSKSVDRHDKVSCLFICMLYKDQHDMRLEHMNLVKF